MSGACPSLGFVLTVAWSTGNSVAWRSRFEAELQQLAAELALTVSGGGDEVARYVVMSESSQVTEREREQVVAWMRVQLGDGTWRASELLDLDELA